ncbi:hypothetical protein O9929_17360 [Vibrio lentus]|nr:hypothetical protein [Vibrio lentus]
MRLKHVQMDASIILRQRHILMMKMRERIAHHQQRFAGEQWIEHEVSVELVRKTAIFTQDDGVD